MNHNLLLRRIPRSALNHISAAIVILTIFSCNNESTNNSILKVKNGKLILPETFVLNQTSIKLDGEWDFYYQKFLSSADFGTSNSQIEKGIVSIPGFWNEIKYEGKEYDAKSYGTFRMLLTLPNHLINQKLSFYVPHSFTTYRMFLNGSMISENGIVGTNEEDTKEYWLPKIVFFTPNAKTMEIIIHVANFKSLNAGFRQSIEFGTEETMLRTKQTRVALDIFLIASLFVISLYHFTLFLLRKKDLSLLYFSLYSFSSMIYQFTSGEFFLMILFPDFEWRWLIKIFFISIYLTFPFLLSFIGKVFTNEINKIPLNLFQFIFFSFSVFVLFSESTWIEKTLLPAEISMLFCCIYIFWILTKAVIHKRESASGFLFGFLFLFLTILNDILFEKNIIKTEVYAPIGNFVLFFSQSFFLSKNHSKLHVTIEKQKLELEQSVILKDKIYHANIQSKRMELELYKKSIQPHFLMNSLSAIRYWVSESPDKSEQILDSLVGELHIILKVASKQLIPIVDEIALCKYHIGVMKMRMEKDYRFKTIGISPTEVIPPLIFHTLIENAFTHEDSLKARLSFVILKKNIKKDGNLFSVYCFIVYNHCKVEKENIMKHGSGTGLEYVRLRLEESYSGKWSLQHGKSKKGYRVIIQIQTL